LNAQDEVELDWRKGIIEAWGKCDNQNSTNRTCYYFSNIDYRSGTMAMGNAFAFGSSSDPLLEITSKKVKRQ